MECRCAGCAARDRQSGSPVKTSLVAQALSQTGDSFATRMPVGGRGAHSCDMLRWRRCLARCRHGCRISERSSSHCHVGATQSNSYCMLGLPPWKLGCVLGCSFVRRGGGSSVASTGQRSRRRGYPVTARGCSAFFLATCRPQPPRSLVAAALAREARGVPRMGASLPTALENYLAAASCKRRLASRGYAASGAPGTKKQPKSKNRFFCVRQSWLILVAVGGAIFWPRQLVP